MTRDHARAVLRTIPGRKSTYSGDSGCVAVVAVPDCPWVGIQDHKWLSPGGTPTVVVTRAQFRRFVDSLR